MGTFHPPVCPPVPPEDYPLRSLYMRLYRARVDAWPFYPVEHVGREIDGLLAAGHVEAFGGGYRLTEAGVVAWAIMNEHVLFRHDNLRFEYNDELRKVITDMALISDDSRRVLEQLIEHEEGLPKDDISTSLNGLFRGGYIRMVNRDVFITEAGKRVLNGPPSNEPGTRIPRTRKGLKNPSRHTYNGALAHSDIAGSSDVRADMVIDDAMARKRSVLPAPVTELERTVQAMSKDTCTSDCEKCLKARVLDMVADRLPEVRDLLEAVRAQDEAKRSQDVILKAIGKS